MQTPRSLTIPNHLDNSPLLNTDLTTAFHHAYDFEAMLEHLKLFSDSLKETDRIFLIL